MTEDAAEQLGRDAFARGDMGVPMLNAQIQEAVKDMPVGTGAVKLFIAFNHGWNAANLAVPWED